MTVEQLKVNYKESMLLQKVYEEATKDVTTVPDADIEAYYDENKADYFVDETRTARHILVSPSVEEENSTTSTHRGRRYHHDDCRAHRSRVGSRLGRGRRGPRGTGKRRQTGQPWRPNPPTTRAARRPAATWA